MALVFHGIIVKSLVWKLCFCFGQSLKTIPLIQTIIYTYIEETIEVTFEQKKSETTLRTKSEVVNINVGYE